MRFYLDLSKDIRSIMEFRQLDMRGSAAYRPGFCVPKLVAGYSTIWTLGLAITVFVNPIILLLQSMPLYRKVKTRILQTLRIPIASPEQQILERAISFQQMIADMLTALAVGIAFGAWSPILLLLTCALAPSLLLVFHAQTFLTKFHFEEEQDQTTSDHDVLWQHRQYSTQDLQQIRSSDVHLFCENLVAFVKVPVPRNMIRWLSIYSLWVGILVVLFDFG